MVFEAERPLGAAMDVAELEYCSALRQTDPSCLRSNGSISAEDIRLHLWSRHGVKVSVETIEQEILVGLAGGQEYIFNADNRMEAAEATALDDEERPAENMPSNIEPERRITPLDLVQQVAILLIPELKKLAVSSVDDHTDATGTATLNEMDEDQESNEADEAVTAARGTYTKHQDPTIDINIDIKLGDEHSESTADRTVKANGSMQFADSKKARPGSICQSSGGDVGRRYGNWASIKALSIPGLRPSSSLLPTTEPALVDAVLLVILETAGLSYGVELTSEVIQKILQAFGEELWPKEVIEQMMVQASGSIGNGNYCVTQSGLVLDRRTFLKALTADLDVYDERIENRCTTHFTDANANEIESDRKSSAGTSSPFIELVFTHLVDRSFTASSIDFTADTYASFSWAILVWLSVGMVFFSYFFSHLQDQSIRFECDGSSFGCTVAKAIAHWLEIMLKLCILGGLYVSLTTMGNSIYLLEYNHKKKLIGVLAILVSICMVVIVTIIPYKYEFQTVLFNTYKDEAKTPLYVGTLIIGCILLVLQVIQLVRILLPNGKKLRAFAASSATALEMTTKKAASFKVRRMMQHAVACHSSADSRSSAVSGAMNRDRLDSLKIDGSVAQALYRYQEKIMGREKVGGMLWIAKSVMLGKNTLARQEGVWIFPRLIWSHLGQWFVCGGFIYLSWYFSQHIAAGTADVSVLSELDILGLQIISAAGAAFAIAVCLVSTIRFLPSVITTVLCFRHGTYGSLRDPNFVAYRCRQDTGSTIFGSCIWGLIISGSLCWVVVSLVVFGFLYNETRDLFLYLLAQIIGICSTLLIKFIVLQILRVNLFAAFYRRRPAFANIMMTVVECWNLGLSTGYILARAIKLIFLAFFYIARIDTPFLAEGVGWIFRIPLDGYPLDFRQELLVHEAHRHPYMERWALMYLLKLRHGRRFGTPAGAAWRILFTKALMPWLTFHRVLPEVREESRAQAPEEERATSTSMAEIQNLRYEVEKLREQSLELARLREENKLLRKQSGMRSLSHRSRSGRFLPTF